MFFPARNSVDVFCRPFCRWSYTENVDISRHHNPIPRYSNGAGVRRHSMSLVYIPTLDIWPRKTALFLVPNFE